MSLYRSMSLSPCVFTQVSDRVSFCVFKQVFESIGSVDL